MSAHPRSGRGFGGQVGIVWFQRKASVSSPSSSIAGFPLPNAAAATATANDDKRESDHDREDEIGGGESFVSTFANVPVLGWDDVLCRPIYYVPTAKAPVLLPTATSCPHVTSSEDDSDEEEEDGDDTNLAPRQWSGPKKESSSVAVPNWIHSRTQGQETVQKHQAASWNSRQKRQRTYTTTKSRLRVLGFSTSCSAGEQPREATRSATPPNESPGVALSRRRGESPEKLSHAALWAPTQLSTRVSAYSTKDDLNFDEARAGRREAGKKRRRVTPATSVSTPLSVVRKYFQDLDSHHPLLLENNHSSVASTVDNGGRRRRTGNGRVDGRSVRPILESNPIVSREYENHHRSCREAGVSPLSWKPFLQLRPHYHATMYEGMLDD